MTHQVWTRRTFSCPQALHCPAGGALATVQPVRSRSSVVPAASRDPALRKLCDHSAGHVPQCTTDLLHLQGTRPHAALNFVKVSSTSSCVALAGEDVLLCSGNRGEMIQLGIACFLGMVRVSHWMDGEVSGRLGLFLFLFFFLILKLLIIRQNETFGNSSGNKS